MEIPDEEFAKLLKRIEDLEGGKCRFNCRSQKEASDEIERLQARAEELEEKLRRINQWCRAYPRTVFIEPTDEQWRIADETLGAHKGDNCPSLTAISGANMRHVVEGIQALSSTEQGK